MIVEAHDPEAAAWEDARFPGSRQRSKESAQAQALSPSVKLVRSEPVLSRLLTPALFAPTLREAARVRTPTAHCGATSHVAQAGDPLALYSPLGRQP